MRKYQDLAAQDDAGSWHAVSGMWPTLRGTYETADISVGSAVTGPGLTIAACYALACGRDPTSGVTNEYVAILDNTSMKVYSWDGTTLTQRASYAGITLRGFLSMARFNNSVTLCAAGVAGQKIQAAATFASNFADIASAPTLKDILVIQSNVALAFYHGNSNWHTSDVGDYTNWSTLEASNGTIPFGGTVNAAVAYGNDVYVFKAGSIWRMTYVSVGTIKWQVQLAWKGTGVPRDPFVSPTQPSQDWAVATNRGIAYYGGNGYVYLFDGSSAPRVLNPLTTIPIEAIGGVFTYDASQDMLCIAPSAGSSSTGTAFTPGASSTFTSLYYYYSFQDDAWGVGVGSDAELQTTAGSIAVSGVMRGNYYDRVYTSSKPVFWVATDALSGVIRRCAPTDPTSATVCYLQSKKIGDSKLKTAFDRMIVKGRRRTDLGSGSASLSMELFRELEDTSAQSTRTVSEATGRKRFELDAGANVDCFGRFKVTWTGLDVEVDDFDVVTKPAGKE